MTKSEKPWNGIPRAQYDTDDARSQHSVAVFLKEAAATKTSWWELTNKFKKICFNMQTLKNVYQNALFSAKLLSCSPHDALSNVFITFCFASLNMSTFVAEAHSPLLHYFHMNKKCCGKSSYHIYGEHTYAGHTAMETTKTRSLKNLSDGTSNYRFFVHLFCYDPLTQVDRSSLQQLRRYFDGPNTFENCITDRKPLVPSETSANIRHNSSTGHKYGARVT